MTIPATEPKRELIVQDMYESIYAIKTDADGNYFNRPKRVSRQPIAFEDCKVFDSYYVTDGDTTFDGRPGGDMVSEFPVMVWVYAKDTENVSRLRNRIILDVIVAAHGDRSRSDLAYDSRVQRAISDNGVFAPLTWIMIEFLVRYRTSKAEV